MTRIPSQAQLRVLRLIHEFQVRNGYPPTAQEIAEALGRSFKGSVGYHLSRMQARGYLAPRANCRQLWQILVDLPTPVGELPAPAVQDVARTDPATAPSVQPSPDQLRILRLIRDFQARHGYPPTVRDVAAAHPGWSIGGLCQQLNLMVRLGFLAPRANCRQRWRILTPLPEPGP